MGKAITWSGVMGAAMRLPGVRVDREKFLSQAFAPYGVGEGDFATHMPGEMVPPEVVDRVAGKVIARHTRLVTLTSTAAGMPGGLALIGTIPADIAQFYWHFLVMAQKLAYLYGWPDISDESEELGEGARGVLTLFVGVALGAGGAVSLVREVAEQAAKQYARTLSQQVLTQTSLHPVMKQVASYIGIKLTHDGAGKAVGKVIPLVGGVISGSLTFATFRPMASRLRKELRALAKERADGTENANE